jgi:predicted SprT family Zn-dependent metalloprotease
VRIALRTQGAPKDATSRILGHVMAHEMGHLLLPANSHSQSGVMHADWDSEQLLRMVKGLLQFTPEQGELIRSHVSSAHPQS